MATAERVQVLAGEVVLDYSIYPRRATNIVHVAALADALRAGAVFPPVIIDAATNRVVDGFHRTQAILKVSGPEGLLTVEPRQYTSEQEVFLDSVRFNSAHGQPLSMYDKTHIITLGRQLVVDETLLAEALSISPERLGQIEAGRTGLDENGEALPLKGSVLHLHGRRVTAAQREAIEKASGMKHTFHINQIIAAIRSGLINKESDVLKKKLVELREVLDEFLG